ncbi:MAG TPA: hypothetical protein PLN61_11425, partial [bacterium]|nr:hypothetical protein [bacterium]
MTPSLPAPIRLAAALLLLLGPRLLFSSQPDAAVLRQGIEWGVIHEYDRALDLFDRVIRDYPGRPEGPFYRAAICQSMMLDFESGEWRDAFYQGIDTTIALAKRLLRSQPRDPDAQFYAGAAYAYKSAQ